MTIDPGTHRTIPVSRFEPVALQRPLRLFGGTFQVHISSPLTFSPATVLKVTTGRTLLQFLRKCDANSYVALLDLWRGMTRRNKLTPKTRKRIEHYLASGFSHDVLNALMVGEEPGQELLPCFDWAILEQQISAPP